MLRVCSAGTNLTIAPNCALCTEHSVMKFGGFSVSFFGLGYGGSKFLGLPRT